jgi:CelD/BcsL family acetyltransferase involved in cellulose biosynthesis
MAASLTHSNSQARAHVPGLLALTDSPPSKTSRTENQALSVLPYDAWEELEEKIPAWEAILDHNRSLSIFSTPEWLGSWWKAFRSNKRPSILAFAGADNSMAGLLPGYLEEFRSPFFTRLAGLRFVGDGTGDSDNLDLIVRPGFENACAQALLSWLTHHKHWDVCFLNTFPRNSRAAAALVDELKRGHWPCVIESSPNSAIQLPDSWRLYVESLSPSFRPLVTRYPRRLAERYQVRIHRCEDPGELSTKLEILFSLHQKRWNLVNQPGSFGSRERRAFYFEMGQSFLRKGWLEFWLMELNGVPAAAQYCFRYRDAAYILQEGFDPKFAMDKPGYALRAVMLKHLIETGVKRYDFLGGLDSHKHNWGAKPGAYLNLRFARPGSAGSLYLSCTSSMAKSKEWLRVHLPASAWNVLHGIKINLTKRPAASPSISLREAIQRF